MSTTTKNKTVVRHVIPEPEGYDEELESKIATCGNYHIWTDEDIAKLKRYYGIVKTTELAENIGVHYKKLQNKARELGLSFKERQTTYLLEKEGSKD
jgi:hypothetical protein